MWLRRDTAPFGRDLEVAVIANGEVHAVPLPCRRVLRGWISAETKQPIEIYPTHWRDWQPPPALVLPIRPGVVL